MNDRLYFLLGDSLANAVTGIVAGVSCALLFDPEWNMFVAMVIGMSVGMAQGFVLGALVFGRYFGAIEVMVPTMQSGMWSGMVVAMTASMRSISLADAAGLGVFIGLGVLAITYIANFIIKGAGQI